MPPVRNAPSDTQTKRARKKPDNYNPRIGKSGELMVTPHPNNGSGSAKRKRQTSILEGAQDAMADATAGAMSLDIRDAPGSRKKAGVKLRKQTSDEAESEKEPDGEEEQDGEEEAEDGDHLADEAAEDEEEEENSDDDDDDDDNESGGSESGEDGSGSGSDPSGSEAELAGARKLKAASSAQRPKEADKEKKKVGQGKKAVVEGTKEGQGNKIRQEKPVKESQQGKKHKPQQNPTVMIVIICDKSQSDR